MQDNLISDDIRMTESSGDNEYFFKGREEGDTISGRVLAFGESLGKFGGPAILIFATAQCKMNGVDLPVDKTYLFDSSAASAKKWMNANGPKLNVGDALVVRLKSIGSGGGQTYEFSEPVHEPDSEHLSKLQRLADGQLLEFSDWFKKSELAAASNAGESEDDIRF